LVSKTQVSRISCGFPRRLPLQTPTRKRHIQHRAMQIHSCSVLTFPCGPANALRPRGLVCVVAVKWPPEAPLGRPFRPSPTLVSSRRG